MTGRRRVLHRAMVTLDAIVIVTALFVVTSAIAFGDHAPEWIVACAAFNIGVILERRLG